MDWTKLLGVLFVNLLFAVAIFRYKYDPCWMASHACVVFLYVSLYCRRRRDLPPVLRQRLGHAAVSLVAILAAIFFYNFAPGVSGWIVVSVLLALAAAAYFAYDVVLFHQEEEAAAVLVR